ncbi:MAG: EAL domain-containing protein [Cyanobacteriota bacterium]
MASPWLPDPQPDPQLFEQVMRHADIAMALATADGRLLEVNPALCRMLGRSEASIRQLALGELSPPDDLGSSLPLLEEITAERCQSVQIEQRFLHGEGHAIRCQVSVSGLRREDRWLFIIQAVELPGHRERHQPLADQALRQRLAGQTDPLTGLPSRVVLLERIDATLRGADHRAGWLAVLSVGMDGLSQVNHALTHRAGDQLLATVASRLVEALDEGQAVARGTGDTFIVYLDQLPEPEQAGRSAERLRLAIKGTINFEGHPINPSVSIGVAVAGAALAMAPSADELLRDATLAMRQATSLGRDRWSFADPDLAIRARAALRLQEDLRLALDAGELEAWFMPLVDLGNAGLQGFEALVRWQRRDGRLELPDMFLPCARRGRLAEAIDLQMLRQSIDALASLPERLIVAANLSAETLARADLAALLQRWLEEKGVAPQRLHLEITETALITLGPEVNATIQGVAALGVRWLVDDFGTGFSSISHLRDLPIHSLKLDQSFTDGLRRGDQKSVRLVQALAGLAEGLGLDTVAEGIESAEEAASLRDLGWRCGQGWYFGKAAPLRDWRWQALASCSIAAPRPPSGSRSRWALAVTDHVPVGLFALRLTGGRHPEFVFVSRRWLEMLQLEREQVMRHPAALLSRVHPEDRPGLIQLWQQHGIRNEPLIWEGRLRAAAPSWLLLEATPLLQDDGSCIWQGVISDITARKKQELHLQRLLDEAPIPIAIQELGGEDPRITFVNQQFRHCFGYDLTSIPRLSEWARLA